MWCHNNNVILTKIYFWGGLLADQNLTPPLPFPPNIYSFLQLLKENSKEKKKKDHPNQLKIPTY